MLWDQAVTTSVGDSIARRGLGPSFAFVDGTHPAQQIFLQDHLLHEAFSLALPPLEVTGSSSGRSQLLVPGGGLGGI